MPEEERERGASAFGDEDLEKGAANLLAAAHEALAQADGSVLAAWSDYSRRFRRFLTAGAAGGLVLSVTFAASVVGSGTLIPWPLTLTVIIFSAALLLGGWLVYAERDEVRSEALRAVTLILGKKLETSSHRLSKASGILLKQRVLKERRSLPMTSSVLENVLMGLVLAGLGSGLLLLLNFTTFP